MNRHWVAWAALLALPVLVAQESVPKKTPEAERAEYFHANYTKYEYMIPMRDGVRLFTAVYAPKDTSQKYPILLSARPTPSSPYGADNYSRPAAITESSPRRASSSSTRMCAAAMSEGEFVNVRPHIPVKNGPKDIDEAPTPTTPSTGW